MSTEQVCIIGAGLAGLSAALYLARRNIPVTLIEKEDRPGGLAGSVRTEDERIEIAARGDTVRSTQQSWRLLISKSLLAGARQAGPEGEALGLKAAPAGRCRGNYGEGLRTVAYGAPLHADLTLASGSFQGSNWWGPQRERH